MVKEFYDSIKVDIRDKSRNPFIGAFILVWTIRNWKAVYTFFNFDEGTKREQRISTLEAYFENQGLGDFFISAGIALVLIAVSYTLLNITRAIVNLFEKRVYPRVLKWTWYKDIVPLDDHEKLMEEKSKVERKYNEVKEELSKLRLEVEELEKRNVVLKPNQSETQMNVGKKLSNVATEQLNQKNEKRQDALARKIAEKMSDRIIYDFINIYQSVENDEPVDPNTDMDFLNSNELFEPQNITKSGFTFFKATDLGKKVYEYVLQGNVRNQKKPTE